MKVLGVDPGTAATGYGVVARGPLGGFQLVECGVIRPTRGAPLPLRLRELHEDLTALLHRHQPDVLAVEEAFHAKNARTTLVLGHARGVILLAGAEAGVEIAEYPPAVIKKAVTGKGAAQKPQVGYMVAQLLRLKEAPKPADAADGVAVALTRLLGARHQKARGMAAPHESDAMIASITGTLREREGETLLIETAGGVGYAVTVPLGTLERIPAAGQPVSLLTELVVREDSWSLYGFDRAADRAVFQRLLSASGVGPKLALAVLSALGAERTVRSIQQRDLATLASVPGIGRKKAEKLAVELADRLVAVPSDGAALPAGPADEAVQALVRLGYPPAIAEDAVCSALAEGVTGTGAVVRTALQALAGKR